jgi:hypothetical protein
VKRSDHPRRQPTPAQANASSCSLCGGMVINGQHTCTKATGIWFPDAA